MANDQLSPQQTHKLTTTWWMLKLTYGLIPLIAGTDKFFNLITNWEQYLNPELLKMVPVTPMQLMYGVGIIEIAAGLLVLTYCTRLGGYVVALWLVAVAVSLVAMGHFYDIAIRDIAMAVGAIALAQITEILPDQRKA